MALQILMKRIGYSLRPWDEFSEADMLALSDSGPIMVTLTKKRSVPHHRLYFGCLGSMIRAGAPGETVEFLHDATKVKTGLVRFATMPNGEFMAFADSTSFDAMDQDAFNKWFVKAVEYWRSSGLIRWLKPELLAMIETVFHDPQERAA